MKKSLPERRFKVQSHKDEASGQYRWASVAVCGGCGNQQPIISSKNNALPDEFVSTKLRQMGWEIASRKQNDTCPACIAANQQRKAMKPEPVSTEPRIATREEKRKIRVALDEHYDDRAGQYSGVMTDEKLAASLTVPRAWVADIREEYYGPARTEDQIKFLGRINQLENRATVIEAEALAVAERAEKLRTEAGQLRRDAEKLK